MVQFGDAPGSTNFAWDGAGGGFDSRATFVNAEPQAPDDTTRIDAEVINQILAYIMHLQVVLGNNFLANHPTLASRLTNLPEGASDPFRFWTDTAYFDVTDIQTSGGKNGAGYMRIERGAVVRYINFDLTNTP